MAHKKSRKRHRLNPRVKSWLITAIVLLLLYPVSFGPACWISSRAQPSGEVVSAVYRPVISSWRGASPEVRDPVTKFVIWGIPGGRINYRGDAIDFQ